MSAKKGPSQVNLDIEEELSLSHNKKRRSRGKEEKKKPGNKAGTSATKGPSQTDSNIEVESLLSVSDKSTQTEEYDSSSNNEGEPKDLSLVDDYE
eukprot:3430957-Ditylum_brightwellii.AAC.1